MVLFWDNAKFRLEQRKKVHGGARPCSGSSFASSSVQEDGGKMVQVRGGEASKWNSNRQRLWGDSHLLPREAAPDRLQGGGNEQGLWSFSSRWNQEPGREVVICPAMEGGSCVMKAKKMAVQWQLLSIGDAPG